MKPCNYASFASHVILLALVSVSSAFRTHAIYDSVSLRRSIHRQRALANAPRSLMVMKDTLLTPTVVHEKFIAEKVLDRPLTPIPPDQVASLLATAETMGGLRGRGLAPGKEYPSKKEMIAAIPRECFRRSTFRSMLYAAGSLAATLSCGLAAAAWLPMKWVYTPLWLAYAVIAGSLGTGCWVVAHECGHNAFSDTRWLQTAVGYVFHSALLVPYFSWQRTHAVHHAQTNHMSLGETHVPPIVGNALGDAQVDLAQKLGPRLFPVVNTVLHLLVGWPAYILMGATGGYQYGKTSHFWPWKKQGKEIFTSAFLKQRVLISDLGVGVMLAALFRWVCSAGAGRVALLYGLPYLVVNAQLVGYTWLQHTDVDVPHYDSNEWNWVKGAFQTIDRPYGAILDLVHHKIGSTHVAHHLASNIPHYHASKATDALREAFPDLYLRDPTPIPQALWRVARHCVAVRKLPGDEGMYVYGPAY